MIIKPQRDYHLLWNPKGNSLMYSATGSRKMIADFKREWTYSFTLGQGFTLKQVRTMFNGVIVTQINKENIPNHIKNVHDREGYPVWFSLKNESIEK